MRVLEILASSASLIGAVAVLVAAGESSASTSATGCLEVVEHRAGQDCGASGSYAVRVRNRCEQPVDAKLCIEKPDHTWACETHADLPAGDTKSLVSCDSTGQSWLWARPAHGTEAAPEPSK